MSVSSDPDNDGITNSKDLDDDNDGINDRSDSCEETPLNEIANDEGCSASQRDSDGDGIPDSMDLCWGDDSTAILMEMVYVVTMMSAQTGLSFMEKK